jgi:hypothetical protein
MTHNDLFGKEIMLLLQSIYNELHSKVTSVLSCTKTIQYKNPDLSPKEEIHDMINKSMYKTNHSFHTNITAIITALKTDFFNIALLLLHITERGTPNQESASRCVRQRRLERPSGDVCPGD